MQHKDNCTARWLFHRSEINRYPSGPNKPTEDCRSLCSQTREWMSLNQKDILGSAPRTLSSLGAGVHISQRTPKPPRGHPTTCRTAPEAKCLDTVTGSAGSHPERATWARAWHSPVRSPGRESCGPLQVHSRPGDGAADRSRLQGASQSCGRQWSRAAAIAGGSGGCSKWGGAAGSPPLRALGRGGHCGRTRALPRRGRCAALCRLEAAVRRSRAPCWPTVATPAWNALHPSPPSPSSFCSLSSFWQRATFLD
jgi:hypothetical protein